MEGHFELKQSKETLYIYERTLGEQKARVYCNFSDQAEELQVTEDLQENWTIAIENEGNSLNGTSLHLAPFGTVVFKN